MLTRWQQANEIEDLELIVMPMVLLPRKPQDKHNLPAAPTQVISADEGHLEKPYWEQIGRLAVSLDLGGRVLEVIPTPGIDAQALTVHDPWAKILFTGNTFYPGRLVIRDFKAYLESMQRLVDLSVDNEILHIWGGRIEMATEPGLDYMLRSNYRPNERRLQLTKDELVDASKIVRLINGNKGIHIHDDFIVMHGVGQGARAYGWPVYIPEMFRKEDRTLKIASRILMQMLTPDSRELSQGA